VETLTKQQRKVLESLVTILGTRSAVEELFDDVFRGTSNPSTDELIAALRARLEARRHEGDHRRSHEEEHPAAV
jgi:hypothetical protein